MSILWQLILFEIYLDTDIVLDRVRASAELFHIHVAVTIEGGVRGIGGQGKLDHYSWTYPYMLLPI